jgi:hypothetical protein
MVSKAAVFIRPAEDEFLIAIKKKYLNFISYAESSDMRLTMYLDSDIVNKIEIKTFYVPTTDTTFVVRNNIHKWITEHPHGKEHLTVYANGYEISYSDAGSIPSGSYVDIILDKNSVLDFEIDLTDLSQNYVFYSDKDKTYKQIVHIPKELNPENNVLTHNTADIHVRIVNDDGSIGRGLYLHRCAERGVDQITHNDISIPTFILDAYRDYLDSQEISLRVTFRKHDKDNKLIRDKNYIDLLYTESDENILDHLVGKIDQELYFWKASHLEKSEYVRMMFDVPNIITEDTLGQYIDGLGYYHVMSLLCKKVISSYLYDGHHREVVIPKPYIFQGTKVFPITYLNGMKVPSEQVSYSNADPLSVTVALAEHIPVHANDRLDVELLVDSRKETYAITPSSDNPRLSVPFTNFKILEEFDISITPAKILDGVSTRSYEVFTEITGNVLIQQREGCTEFAFGSQCFNRTFVIQNTECVFHKGIYLDEYLERKDPLYFTLEDGVIDGGYLAAIYEVPLVKAYLNGKYLVPGIDFEVHTLYDRNEKFVCHQLAVYNYEYLKDKDNYLEWFVASADIENDISGHIVDNQGGSNLEIPLYFPDMSVVHAGGMFDSEVTSVGNMLLFKEGKYLDATPFEIQTSVPKVLSKYLEPYYSAQIVDRLEVLHEYFYGKQPTIPEQVVIENSHKCLSNYSIVIIRDILNGTLSGISVDADLDRMRSQFQDYDYIHALDIVMQQKLDLTYIDVYPHYAQIVVPDPEKYRLLQAFIQMIMPEDMQTSGRISY